MNLYEIVNPSDAVTFRAPDDAVAQAAVLLVGNGAYGLRAVSDDGGKRSVQSLLLFLSKDQVEQLFVEWFGSGSLKAFLDSRWAEVAAALASAQNLGPRERLNYESAISKMTPEAADIYRREVEDHCRTSRNEIVKYAWSVAKAERKGSGEAAR